MLGAKRQKLNNIPTTADAADFFKPTRIRWITKANIPLTGPEDAEFYSLIDLASLGSNHLVDLIPSGDNIRAWIIKEFDDRKQEIKRQLLEDAEDGIHLSYDLWTSGRTTMSIIAVGAHYLDKAWVNKTRLIALHRLYGSHSGQNTAGVLISVLQEFEIAMRLGYFMKANAESNDTFPRVSIKDFGPKSTHPVLIAVFALANVDGYAE